MTPSRSIQVWPAETIVLTQGELDLTDTTGTTTINGLGPSQLTISGNNASRVFDVSNGASADISGLTITKGYVAGEGRGGGICNGGTLTISDSTISGNSAGCGGGGIYNEDTLTIRASTISGNTASEGGGIYSDGTVTI